MTFKLKQFPILALFSVLGSIFLLASSQWTYAASPTTTLTPGQALQVLGLVQGTDQGLLEEKSLTREEMVVLLYRLTQQIQQNQQEPEAEPILDPSPAPSEEPKQRFSDVPPSHWAYTIIENSAASGITGGIGNGKFGLGQQVSYRQALLMIVRTLQGPKQISLDGIEAYAKTQLNLESKDAQRAIVFARKHAFELLVQAVSTQDEAQNPLYRRLVGSDTQKAQLFEAALLEIATTNALKQEEISGSASGKTNISIVKKENYGTANDDRYREFLAQAMSVHYQKLGIKEVVSIISRNSPSKKPELSYVTNYGTKAHLLLGGSSEGTAPQGTVLFTNPSGSVALLNYGVEGTYAGKGTFEGQSLTFYFIQFAEVDGVDGFTVFLAADANKSIKLGLVNGGHATSFTGHQGRGR